MVEGFKTIWPSIPYIVAGAKITLLYAFLSTIFGLCGSIVLVAARLSSWRIWRGLAGAYISIFRGTPLLLQLVIVYFSFPQIFHWNISPFSAGLLTFSLNSSAYVAEVLRAGIQSVNRGQLEVAKVLGVSRFHIFKDITLPQAFRNVLPALVNEVVSLIKESSLVSVIGEADLLRRANMVSSEYYLYLPPLLVAGVCYYVMVLMVSGLARFFERRMACSR